VFFEVIVALHVTWSFIV